MTRLELITLLVGQARHNGFEFRRWYTGRLDLAWHGTGKALEVLQTNRQYYALLFSHEFAQSFWKAGADMTFQVPAGSFQRVMPDGSTATVLRKPFMRRIVRPDAWRYHLREMASVEEPLRYMRRYLRIEDEPSAEVEPPAATGAPATLALARKVHERRLLALEVQPVVKRSQRAVRLPGSRTSR